MDDEQDFGITIINDSDDVLYPYLYYFDPNDFSISESVLPCPMKLLTHLLQWNIMLRLLVRVMAG